jgi:hypothetical protein
MIRSFAYQLTEATSFTRDLSESELGFKHLLAQFAFVNHFSAFMSSAEGSSQSPEASASIASASAPTGQRTLSQPKLQLNFPAGAPPDISMGNSALLTPQKPGLLLFVTKIRIYFLLVRANQKDVYYQNTLQEQMTDVFQRFIGEYTYTCCC